eukprot:Opistho-2@60615
MGLFGKSKTPQELVRDWRLRMKHEERTLERQIRAIQTEENKVKISLKAAAKKGDADVCKILAKEIIQSRKAVNKMYASKAQINSVVMSMQQQLAMAKLANALGKSTEVMKAMSALVKIPEVQATMMELSKEMMKAGLIEEMMEDAMTAGESDDLDAEADAHVDALLWEITNGALGSAGHVSDSLGEGKGKEAEAADEEDGEDVMQARLEALRTA